MSEDPRESGPLVLTTTVSQRRLRAARYFGYASLASVLLSMLATALGIALIDIVGAAALWWAPSGWLMLLIGFASSPFLALASALMSSSTVTDWSGGCQVSVSADGLGFRKGGIEHFIDRARITNAVVLSVPQVGVELSLRGGDVLRLDLASEEEAEALVERLGFGPAQHRVTVRLASPQRQLAAGCIGLPVGIVAFWQVAVALNEAGLSAGAAGLPIAVGTLATTLLLFYARRPPEIVVGTDGVLVRTPFRKNFYPISEISAVTAKTGELRLHFRKSRDVVVRGEPDLVMAAARRIEAAHEAHSSGEATKTVAELLDVGNRSLADWRADLSALTKEAGYRHAAITPEALRSVLEDPEEAHPRRIGAAMLLRIASPEAAPRIRIAADACADDDLRAALEAAAEDEVSDAVLARIVAKRP